MAVFSCRAAAPYSMISFIKRAQKALDVCQRNFGQEAEYRPRTGNPFKITGIFIGAHELVDVGSGVEISTTAPTLSIRLSDFTVAPNQDDQVLVGATLYRVVDVQDDSPGVGKLLILHKS